MHDEPLAAALDRHVVEQAGCEQRFQRRIARGLVKPSVGSGMEIGAHGLGIDAAIAFDRNRSRAASAFGDNRRQRRSTEQRRKPRMRPAALRAPRRIALMLTSRLSPI